MRRFNIADGVAGGIIGVLAAGWGFGGAFAVIAYAVWRLTPVAYQSLLLPLTAAQYALLVVFVAYMLYAEGYRGFQRAFAPRVAARCLYLRRHPTPLRIALAPLFVVGFFHAPRRRVIVSCAMTAAIVCLVVVVSRLDQPWRGIIDAGVVAGLVWGLCAMLFFIAQAIVATAAGRRYNVSPEVA